MILEGQQVKIDTPTLKKLIGVKVKYMMKRQYTPRVGIVTEIIRRQIDFGCGDFIPFNRIEKIIILDENQKLNS